MAQTKNSSAAPAGPGWDALDPARTRPGMQRPAPSPRPCVSGVTATPSSWSCTAEAARFGPHRAGDQPSGVGCSGEDENMKLLPSSARDTAAETGGGGGTEGEDRRAMHLHLDCAAKGRTSDRSGAAGAWAAAAPPPWRRCIGLLGTIHIEPNDWNLLHLISE